MTNQEFIESIRLEGEEWRDMVGFEGRYAISSFGRAVSLYRERVRSDGEHHHSEQKILNGYIGGNRNVRYVHLDLIRDNQTKYRTSIHREVAKAFIPNPNNFPNVDHIDTNGLNNHIWNLRWCTQAMNVHNPLSRKKALRASAARIGVPNIPLEKKVVQLRDGKIVRVFVSLAECYRNGFEHSAVCRCCRGQKPQYKGYTWMYLSDYEKLVNKSKNSKEIEPEGSPRLIGH